MTRKTVMDREPQNPRDPVPARPAGEIAGGAEDALSRLGGVERRLHARAYHHWVSLSGEARFPSIRALDTEAIGDFAANSVLLDFRGDRIDPAIAYIGQALREECGTAARPARIGELPEASLLARLTRHFDHVLADQVPAGFEAEFVNARGRMTLYRGILLPYSSDGLMIDFIHGVLSWKELADPLLQAALDSELMDSAGEGIKPPPPGSAAALWNGPPSPGGEEPEAIANISWPTDAQPGTPVVMVGRVAGDGSVSITGTVVGDARLAERVLRASQ
ncbi:hypothetical protein [Sphingomonas yabuuchiae]|uniref:PAS domain-containing protein n=1 Tax=Sphingomonas yabuuchiae TaxID=172044 RepID=A0AA41DCG0_9SPHN|nr:hypothetical protein [Sphingomonas yabuuchiae]MBB4609792.1 hypothetical protein [Sphingomonas yabuuchiae]MBN3558104.1 hypothetical protein [Sphingomonas yabuuchiae]